MSEKKEWRELTPDSARGFRAELRAARDAILANAEAVGVGLTAIDGLGSYLSRIPKGSLSAYEDCLVDLAGASSLETEADFGGLLQVVIRSRNDLMHEGAAARNLADQVVRLCLVLEDALAKKVNLSIIAHYMVEHPTCAERWHTLKQVRRIMLSRQFSYLPVRLEADHEWQILSDLALREYLNTEDRAQRMLHTVTEAAKAGLALCRGRCADRTDNADKIAFSDHLPILVVDNDHLLGIVTPFDLL